MMLDKYLIRPINVIIQIYLYIAMLCRDVGNK